MEVVLAVELCRYDETVEEHEVQAVGANVHGQGQVHAVDPYHPSCQARRLRPILCSGLTDSTSAQSV
jgi:hypothetical protein